MIQRRTLLTALSLAFVTACARAQAGATPTTKSGEMTGMSGQTLGDLIGGPGQVAWLNLAGTVRLTLSNGDARAATLQRAMMLSADGTSARLFDVWQIAGERVKAAPSITNGAGVSQNGPNDVGIYSVWLSRSFSHGALKAPIEYSRLARQAARVMVIDDTQIWLLEGGIAATAPTLAGAELAAFEAWRVG